MIQSILQPQCLDALGDVGIAVKWRVFVGHFLIILFQFLETDNNYLFWWINIIVWGFKLNNTRVCNEQIQVSTHTGRYQLPIFHCTNSVAQMCTREDTLAQYYILNDFWMVMFHGCLYLFISRFSRHHQEELLKGLQGKGFLFWIIIC